MVMIELLAQVKRFGKMFSTDTNGSLNILIAWVFWKSKTIKCNKMFLFFEASITAKNIKECSWRDSRVHRLVQEQLI